MVNLKILINPAESEGKPQEMFLIAFIWSILSFFISKFLFKNIESFALVFIAAIACIPWAINIFKYEAEKGRFSSGSIFDDVLWLLGQHKKALAALLFLTLGFLFGFLFVFIVYGPNYFQAQLFAINEINSPSTGAFIKIKSPFLEILLNNSLVFLIAVFLSLVFGAAAMLVLAWNASVISVAIGEFLKMKQLAAFVFLLHGIPELLAFLIGALAGGILFQNSINKNLNARTAIDILALTAIGIFILIISAGIEIFISAKLISF